MFHTHVPVPAGGKTPADGKGNQATNYLYNTYHFSKGQLFRRMEEMQAELDRKDADIARLMNQRINDQETINEKNNKILEQQNEIIELYSKLNISNPSPLRIAG